MAGENIDNIHLFIYLICVPMFHEKSYRLRKIVVKGSWEKFNKNCCIFKLSRWKKLFTCSGHMHILYEKF